MPDYNYIQRVYKIYEHVTNTIVQRLPKKIAHVTQYLPQEYQI